MGMIDVMRGISSKRASVLVVSTSMVAILWITAFAAEARVVDRQRYSDTSIGHEFTCGRHLQVVTTMSGTLMTKSSHGDLPSRSYDNYNIHEVLTDAAGEGYIIDQAGLYSEVRVRHARGTLDRYTAINVGQAFTIRTLGGKA